ncbi:MAG: hypothetical protein ACRCVV_22060 [Shewanella sp.]
MTVNNYSLWSNPNLMPNNGSGMLGSTQNNSLLANTNTMPAMPTNSFWDASTQVTPESLMGGFNAQQSQYGWGNQSLNMSPQPQPNAPVSFWDNPDMLSNVGKGLQGISAVGNTVLGFQKMNQAKDQAAFQKEAFWLNYNQQIADREEAARRRASANAVSKG